MQDLPEPSRVETAGGQQSRQAEIRTLNDVPARYRNYPNFDELTNDPAHHGNKIGKIIREAMAIAEADMSHKSKDRQHVRIPLTSIFTTGKDIRLTSKRRCLRNRATNGNLIRPATRKRF